MKGENNLDWDKGFLTAKWLVSLALSFIAVLSLYISEKVSNYLLPHFLKYDDEMRFDNEFGLVKKFKDYCEGDKD